MSIGDVNGNGWGAKCEGALWGRKEGNWTLRCTTLIHLVHHQLLITTASLLLFYSDAVKEYTSVFALITFVIFCCCCAITIATVCITLWCSGLMTRDEGAIEKWKKKKMKTPRDKWVTGRDSCLLLNNNHTYAKTMNLGCCCCCCW